MSTQPPVAEPVRRSVDAIVFDLVLVAFTGTLVVASLGLRPGVGTVPLLVGVPTLLGSLAILITDVFPGLRPRRAERDGSGGLRGLMAAAKEAEEDDLEVPAGPTERSRQVAFSAWALGLVVVATLTSFYVAVPVALLGLFVAIKLRWRTIVLLLGATLALFYLLFDLFLGVRF